ncbi:hypothetical protein MRF4_21620 [Methylobacterium radiotolerans]|uniref:ATP-binding protein n=1 Tax=Methylobacterium TaxID=407 RepID=UPI002F2BD09D
MSIDTAATRVSELPSEAAPTMRRDPTAGLGPLEYIDHILERELTLTLKGVELGSERDDSMRDLTETAATLYDGRILRELIQNAYDGSGDQERAEILLRLDLTAGAFGVLDVANSGSGFTRDDVDSIVNPARSRKRPGNSIGHKGLGFRSVTLITDDPQIYSRRTNGGGFDGFCFRFASQEDQIERLLLLGAAEHAMIAAGKTHRLQLPIPIRVLSDEVSAYSETYGTLVRLPLLDAEAAKNMEAEWQNLFDERAPLTLFLGRLANLTIEKIGADGRRTRRVLERRSRSARRIPAIPGMTVEEVESDGRDYLIASRAMDRERFLGAVRRALAQRHKVEKWLSWSGDPTVSVALPLSHDSQQGRFYAFLPMEQPAPFSGYLDAPFFPDPDRRTLSLNNALNNEFVDMAAEICVALLRGIADANLSRTADVHAAIDAISWSDSDRIFDAMKEAGIEPAKLPLPTVSRTDAPDRWSTLDRVFDWADGQNRSLKAVWMAKVTGAHLLRRNMGARRTEALRRLGEEADLSLDPDPSRLAIWIPLLAKDLERRRSVTARDWENFYADLAQQSEVLAHLKGQRIFRSDSRELVAAEGGKFEDGRPTQFFINSDMSGSDRARRRRRLDDAGVFPPRSITRDMEFADSTIAWPAEVVSAFVKSGLASEFKLVKVVSRIGELLGPKPRKRDALAVLAWAFRSWKAKRGDEFNKALASAGIMVPRADGTIIRASAALFSAGWRDTQGDLLQELCREAATERDFAALAKRLLLGWEAWPAAPGDTAQDWRDFLRAAGVLDGLPWHRTAEVKMSWWHWKELRANRLETRNFERPLGDTWRPALSLEKRGPTFVSGTYTSVGIPYLVGQARYDYLTGPAKLAYGRLIVNLVASLPEDAWRVQFSRVGARSETITWSSPIATFLKVSEWIPTAGHDEFRGLRVDRCWLGARNEVPRFVPKADRSVREAIETNQKLRQTLISRLAMPSWADVESAPARVTTLGEMLQAGIPESFNDDFRKAVREAWADYAQIAPRPPLPAILTLAVDTREGLSALRVAKTDAIPAEVFVDNGSRPVFQQVLTALGHKTIEIPVGAEAAGIEALADDLNCRAVLIHEDALRVEVDGERFTPSAADQLLVGDGRDWIADVGVLVLEISSRLSSQNSHSARQTLSDAIRRVRIHFSSRITVAVEGSPSPLPAELDGILPIPDSNYPTVLVEGTTIDWETLSRIASAVPLAIARPALMDHFGLTFGALQTEMSREGEWLRSPTDQQLARVLRRPVGRITELLRSLRATTSRLLELVLPIVHACGYINACIDLQERSGPIGDDAEVVAALVRSGIPPTRAREIVAECRESDTLNAARIALSIDLIALNRSLVALGRPALLFRERLLERFKTRVEQRRDEIERAVRDANRDAAQTPEGLQAYVSDCALGWLEMPQAWVADWDDVDQPTVDAEIDRQTIARLGTGPFVTGDAPDTLRQYNRQRLVAVVEDLQQLVRAWCRKKSVQVPSAWIGGLETLGRVAVTSGAFDFARLDDDDIVAALAKASLWPAGMPATRALGALALTESDLAFEEAEETVRQQQQLKERRSLKFSDAEIEGGVDGWLNSVAAAMEAALSSKGFGERSGPASLSAFGAAEPPRRRGSSGSAKDDAPQYMSQEQRDLIGFAGELAAYRYLQRKHRNVRGEHWVSSLGRRFLCLPVVAEQGFDFRVSDAKGFIHYEVKAHSGDPGYVDLERSQVTAAVSMRGEGGNRWRILYVSNARSASVAVHELPNPYTEESAKLFRDTHRQGVRLAIRRE